MALRHSKFGCFILGVGSLFYVLFILSYIIPLSLYRLFVWIYVKIRYGSKYKLMSSADSVYLVYDEGRLTKEYLTVQKGLLIFEGDMTLEEARTYFCSSYFNVRDDEYSDFKLNYLPSFILGVPFYDVQRGRFNPEDHIVDFPSTTSTVTETEIIKYLADNTRVPFKDCAPLWKIHFIEDFAYDNENASTIPKAKKCACVFYFHHVYGDGLSVLQNAVFRINKEKWIPMNIRKLHTPNYVRIFRGICGFLSALRILTTLNSFNGKHFFRRNSYIVDRLSIVSETISEDILREIRMRCKSSVSSIILTAIGETVRQYNIKNNFNSVDEIITFLTVALEGVEKANKTLTNNSSLVHIIVPTNQMTLVQRLSQIQKQLEVKSKESFVCTIPIHRFTKAVIPTGLLKFCKSDEPSLPYAFQLSSVPGPSSKNIVLFGKCKLLDYCGWVPMPTNLGLGISCTATGGVFRLGLNVDKSIFSTRVDAETFANECVRNIYRLLEEVRSCNFETEPKKVEVIKVVRKVMKQMLK